MQFTKKILPDGFYVYLYLRDDGTPYYVGKGKGKRAWSKSSRAVYPPVNADKIRVVQHQLTEQQAFDLEIELVAQYGRQDEGTGILRNGTDGGEGTSGHIKPDGWGENHSKTIKKLMADGKMKNIGDHVRGKKQSTEHIEKRIKAHLGATRSDVTCERIRAKATGRVQTVATIEKRIIYVVCEHCGKEVDKGNHKRWHGDKCESFTGKSHPAVAPKDEKIYTFTHTSGEVFVGSRQQFIDKKNFKRTTLSSLINRGLARLGWQLSK